MTNPAPAIDAQAQPVPASSPAALAGVVDTQSSNA